MLISFFNDIRNTFYNLLFRSVLLWLFEQVISEKKIINLLFAKKNGQLLELLQDLEFD